VIGEILADLATADGTTRHAIDFLRLGRDALG
jgi:sarcosine oxidase